MTFGVKWSVCILSLSTLAAPLHSPCKHEEPFVDDRCGPDGPSAGGLVKDFGEPCGRLRGEKVLNAKPIVASRISMPPPPSFDPGPFLDPITRDVYEHPLRHRLDEPREPPRPRSSIMATRPCQQVPFTSSKTLTRTGVLCFADSHVPAACAAGEAQLAACISPSLRPSSGASRSHVDTVAKARSRLVYEQMSGLSRAHAAAYKRRSCAPHEVHRTWQFAFFFATGSRGSTNRMAAPQHWRG